MKFVAFAASAIIAAPALVQAVPGAAVLPRGNTAFLETQTDPLVAAAMSSEYAAYTKLIGDHPEYASILSKAQEDFTKDYNPDNAMAHMSTYVDVLLDLAFNPPGIGAPTDAPVVPASTPAAASASPNTKPAFLETQTDPAIAAAVSSEYAAFTKLIGEHPEYSSGLYAVQEAFTKDLDPENVPAHVSAYVHGMLSVMVNQDLNAVPTGAPFSPASTRSSPASKPATHTSTSTAPTAASTTTKANSAGNLRPAIALIACAAGAALF